MASAWGVSSKLGSVLLCSQPADCSRDCRLRRLEIAPRISKRKSCQPTNNWLDSRSLRTLDLCNQSVLSLGKPPWPSLRIALRRWRFALSSYVLECGWRPPSTGELDGLLPEPARSSQSSRLGFRSCASNMAPSSFSIADLPPGTA